MADSGLPRITLELQCPNQSHVVRMAAAMYQPEVKSSEVLFVTHGYKVTNENDHCEAVALPFDAEFFKLLTSEAALHAVTTQLASAEVESHGVFRFQSPEAIHQLGEIRTRLRQELQDLLRMGLGGGVPGVLARLLRSASDAWQAEMLFGHEDLERAHKRLCLTWPAEVLSAEELASQMRSISQHDGLNVIIKVCEPDEPVKGPCLALQLPVTVENLGAFCRKFFFGVETLISKRTCKGFLGGINVTYEFLRVIFIPFLQDSDRIPREKSEE